MTHPGIAWPAALGRRCGALPLGHWLLLALLGALVLGNNLQHFGALTEHEIVVGGIAKQMVRDGTWGHLYIGDRDWLEKPPLPHWLAAASVAVFGAKGEWVVRLPSLLEGIGVVLILAALAGRWFGPGVGLLAGLVAIASHSLFLYSRLAENDMVLCLLVVASLAALARTLEATPGSSTFRHWRFLLWLLLGACNLTKGPFYGDLLVGSAALAWMLWQRDWRLPLRLISPLGMLCFALLALAWPLWIWSEGELDTLLHWWFGEMEGRFEQSYYGASQPVWYYPFSLTWQLLPWSPLLLLAWPLAWSRQRRRARTAPRGDFNASRFLLCWAFAPLLLLSLAPHRHHHYALPTLPAQAIMIAAALPVLWQWLAARPALLRRALPVLLLPAAAGLAVLLVFGGDWLPEAAPFLLPFGLPLLAGLLLLTVALRQGRGGLAGLALTGTFLALFWVFGSGLIPRNDPSAADTAFFARAEAAVPADARLVLTGGQEVARFTFYLDHPSEGYWWSEQVRRHVTPGETLYVVARGDNEEKLRKAGTLTLLDRSTLSRFGPEPRWLYGLYRLEVPASSSSTAPDSSTVSARGARRMPAQGPATQ